MNDQKCLQCKNDYYLNEYGICINCLHSSIVACTCKELFFKLSLREGNFGDLFIRRSAKDSYFVSEFVVT